MDTMYYLRERLVGILSEMLCCVHVLMSKLISDLTCWLVYPCHCGLSTTLCIWLCYDYSYYCDHYLLFYMVYLLFIVCVPEVRPETSLCLQLTNVTSTPSCILFEFTTSYSEHLLVLSFAFSRLLFPNKRNVQEPGFIDQVSPPLKHKNILFFVFYNTLYHSSRKIKKLRY